MNLPTILTELPDDHTKIPIEDILKTEGLRDYKVSVTVASGKGDNYLGVLKRIKVTGVDENGKQKQIHLISKLPLDSTVIRENISLGMLYAREIRAYNVNLPKLTKFQDKFNIPQKDRFKFIKCHKTGATEMKEFLILEDMKCKNYEMGDRKKTMDHQHLKLCIKTIANYHALSFAMRQNDPELFSELSKDLENPLKLNPAQYHFFEVIIEKALNVLNNPICTERLKAYTNNFVEKLIYYTQPSTAEPYNVICHGDCWINNFLFKYKGSNPVDMMLLDWQVMRYASPITDLAFLLCICTDEELRRQHYEDLINLYYSSLKDRLNLMNVLIEDVYPEVIFGEHLTILMPFGLATAMILLPTFLAETEDARDMDVMLQKDKTDLSNMRYKNEKSLSRYQVRMRGVINDFLRLGLI